MSKLLFRSLFKVVASLAITIFMASHYMPASHGDVVAIAGPLSTVAGILFGFIIASVSFFSTSANNSLITNMKNTGMYKQLMGQLSHTGLALITSCIFMVIAMFSPFDVKIHNYNLDYIFLSFGFLILCYSLFEFWSCWRKVNLVAKNM
ncbi:hypothetical protein [Aeromonas hydrophila]|uniref:hypothetical protein n=1 Tax=Aeromonas hydrophila TaxID=644 RepID=UPI0011CAFD8B|nr:hypothetical protein [Aeromonas hydrophila]